MENTLDIDKLPSPKGVPVLGNLPEFNAENKHQVLEAWAKEVGNVYKISLMGKKFIVSADPDLNQEILKRRPDAFRRFGKIDEIMSEMGILGVFNAEGEQWKIHRKLTSEALNLKNVQGFFPTLQRVTHRLHDRWLKLAEQNDTIDVQKEMVRYTVDITTDIAFGYDINTLQKEKDVIQDQMEKVFPMINERITAPIPLWRYFKSKKDKAFDQAIESIVKLVHEFIAEARERLKDNADLQANPTNFLEALLVEQSSSGLLSDKEIFGNVFTILLAGEDTTSNSISWTLFYLLQHPEVFQKVREEAGRVCGDKLCPSSNEELAAMRYTEAVAMEAMRLKPVTPNLYMEALKDVTVNGLFIKKGMTVMMQNKVAQTDDAHFTNADQFIPERWIPKACPMHDKHSPQIMRAFGAGPRFCPGRNLAVHEMKMALAMICKNFELTLQVKPEEVIESFAFTMFPKNLKVKLSLR
ncbi:cytochrome P450 [Fulvivirga aurantia]|uniref:cytochrome P450 n=1 Tax=Fulvivirga aurantia TaxID=2529383 RepID=UPI00162AD8B3|nr:cytochrome P450 [Fulvivirga aurantia]